MRYNIENICRLSLGMALSFMIANEAFAQAELSMGNDAPILESSNVIEEDIALFSDAPSYEQNADQGLLFPPQGDVAPSMGVEPSMGGEAIILSSPELPDIPGEVLGDRVLNRLSHEIFGQMSEIERQTAILNLELRREKVKSEIEALRMQRQRAIDEERAAREEKERKRIEWEQEQERKLIEEQRKLREAEIALERLRQGRVISAYKEFMLTESQKWILNNEEIYREIIKLETERDELNADFKKKLSHIFTSATSTKADAKVAKENFERERDNLQTQISILQARLEAAESSEDGVSADNPFAMSEFNPNFTPARATKLSEEYAIMEIRGQGEDLVAKLINQDGVSFMVRKGTSLSTGHIIDEITKSHIRGDKGGRKDFVYFAAGGAVDGEPGDRGNIENYVRRQSSGAEPLTTPPTSDGGGVMSKGIPSLNEGMFVR